MKYGIVGSRSRTDRESVISFIDTLTSADTVISGGCRGVDTWAAIAAKLRDIPVVIFRPDFSGCKNKWEVTDAYYARNKQIAEACDILVAFVSSNRMGGTENTIKHAKKLGKQIILK